MYKQLNQYRVIMEVEPRFWQDPESLKYVYVKGANDTLVPLSAFTHYAPATTPLAVNHQGQFPAVTMSFNLAPGVALGDAVGKVERAMREMGVPSTIRGSFQGIAQAFQDSTANQPWLIAAALSAPPVTAWALALTAGTARSRHALKLSARQALTVPLPPDTSRWHAAADALRRADTLERGAWIVRVSWTADGKSFFAERRLMLP